MNLVLRNFPTRQLLTLSMKPEELFRRFAPIDRAVLGITILLLSSTSVQKCPHVCLYSRTRPATLVVHADELAPGRGGGESRQG